MRPNLNHIPIAPALVTNFVKAIRYVRMAVVGENTKRNEEKKLQQQAQSSLQIRQRLCLLAIPDPARHVMQKG
jgi:hypothetical protein